MEIYLKDKREIRKITLMYWNGATWADYAGSGELMMELDGSFLPGSAAIVMDSTALDAALGWWQGEVDAYNRRERSALMAPAPDYEYLSADEIAAYYAEHPDTEWYIGNDLIEALTESDVRDVIASTGFRGLLGFANITQTQCAKRFGIPLRTIQNWCSSSESGRECALYIRFMIAECLGLIGPER